MKGFALTLGRCARDLLQQGLHICWAQLKLLCLECSLQEVEAGFGELVKPAGACPCPQVQFSEGSLTPSKLQGDDDCSTEERCFLHARELGPGLVQERYSRALGVGGLQGKMRGEETSSWEGWGSPATGGSTQPGAGMVYF